MIRSCAARAAPRSLSLAAVITLAQIDDRTRYARESGALARIETIEEAVEDRGVAFIVRRVSSHARKAVLAKPQYAAPIQDPFLPPEPELALGPVGSTHVAVLNKYPVIDRHILIATRDFAPQDSLIDSADFAALAEVMRGFPSLGFYNGGKEAGASQPHKHLQLVPLPLCGGGSPFPVAPWIEAARTVDGFARLPQFEFAHALARFDPETLDSPDAAARFEGTYRALLDRVGIEGVRGEAGELQSAPYNLLVGRGWMLIVRRRCEHADGISVNTLGYVGSLFVKDEDQLAFVRRVGPLALLQSVAAPTALVAGSAG